MKENSVAKILQVIGWLSMLGAIIASMFTDIDDFLGLDFDIVLMVSGYITAMMFEGFAEIVDLLYKNGKKQDAILALLSDRLPEKTSATKSVLADIESNLPQM